jgi:hypothetical protein
MALDTVFDPGRHCLEMTLAAHRAALPPGPLLGVALHPCGAPGGRSPRATRLRAVPTPRRRHRRFGEGPRECLIRCRFGLYFGFDRAPDASRLPIGGAGTWGFVGWGCGSRAQEQGPKPPPGERLRLGGQPHMNLQTDDPCHRLLVRLRQAALVHPGHQRLALFGAESQMVQGLFHHPSFQTAIRQALSG